MGLREGPRRSLVLLVRTVLRKGLGAALSEVSTELVSLFADIDLHGVRARIIISSPPQLLRSRQSLSSTLASISESSSLKTKSDP